MKVLQEKLAVENKYAIEGQMIVFFFFFIKRRQIR